MDCLLALLFGVALVLVGAYVLGYSVMGWIVRPLEEAAAEESEDEMVIEIRVEDEHTEAGEESENR